MLETLREILRTRLRSIGNRISKILVWLASVVTLDHSCVVVCYWSALNCSVVQCFAAKNKAGTCWLASKLILPNRNSRELWHPNFRKQTLRGAESNIFLNSNIHYKGSSFVNLQCCRVWSRSDQGFHRKLGNGIVEDLTFPRELFACFRWFGLECLRFHF